MYSITRLETQFQMKFLCCSSKILTYTFNLCGDCFYNLTSIHVSLFHACNGLLSLTEILLHVFCVRLATQKSLSPILAIWGAWPDLKNPQLCGVITIY